MGISPLKVLRGIVITGVQGTLRPVFEFLKKNV